jgi:hypothetical protein
MARTALPRMAESAYSSVLDLKTSEALLPEHA